MDITQVAAPTQRVERHWIGGRKKDLVVQTIPVANLYFNIENGRYADRMLLLRRQNPGVDIDPKEDAWKEKIESLLAGEGEGTTRDRAAFERLKEDIKAREQLRPGVVLRDGGVIDGNRRLAALRRLWAEPANTTNSFSTFDAVILPEDTTDEDRWRIEAGLQLGVQERWDYSPVNELLKIRQGLAMYRQRIDAGLAPPNVTAEELVAKSIYGRSARDITEMAARLQLMDEYLAFIGAQGAYDRINEVGEAFLEARKVMTAAENQQRPPAFLAKLRAVLFYVIHMGEMNNYDIREIYRALGGDPRKRGRRVDPKPEILDEFIAEFPDPRTIRKEIAEADFHPDVLDNDDDENNFEDDDVDDEGDGVGERDGVEVDDGGGEPEDEGAASIPEDDTDDGAVEGDVSDGDEDATGGPGEAGDTEGGAAPGTSGIDQDKVGGATERFKRRMKASKKKQTIRKLAEGARTDIENLEKRLAEEKTLTSLSDADRTSVMATLESTASAVARCRTILET